MEVNYVGLIKKVLENMINRRLINSFVIYLCLTIAMVAIPWQSSAQYYSWGSDAPSLKWNHINTPNLKIIYPDTAKNIALRALYYAETVYPDVSYGFRYPALRIPFVLHPENFASNGMVMWMPKRIEYLTTPDIDGYSTLWHKHLVAHEYRHAVQYNNLNRGLVRVASYVLGQQGSFIGIFFMPMWAVEGDAVMLETEMSSFGRGLQPNFTMEYRAMGDFAKTRKNIDKWFCGSFRENIPNHYNLGYQICSYSYNLYNENIWDKVINYSVRNAYMVVSNEVALKKFYDTDVKKLFHSTFADLKNHWDSIPYIENSAQQITPMDNKNYTTYSHPIAIDSTSILAIKVDYDKPSRFVRVDSQTGDEEVVCYTGTLSTRPTMGDGRVWWSEYRRSTLFEQRVNSQLCYMDIKDGKPRTAHKARNVLYPTAIEGDSIAWVEYTPDGRYHIVRNKKDGRQLRYNTPFMCEIHGLAWDNVSKSLYTIVTDDSGMWLGQIDGSGDIKQLTKGAYITINNLRADGGKLYYGSIESGKDEAHYFDIATNREYRISNSTYGSFAPSPSPSADQLYMTTYDKRGYHLSKQQYDKVVVEVKASELPQNIVNPKRKRWDVINLDKVRFEAPDSVSSTERHKPKRYRKLPKIFNFHSWMPVAIDPYALIEEQSIDMNFGATLLTQNLLSNAEGFVSYGWNRDQGSIVKGLFKYSGLGVRLQLNGSYGGDQLIYSISQRNPITGGVERQKTPTPKRYYSIGTSATLPLVFQRGYHTRQLSLSTGWSYSNGMVAKVNDIKYVHDDKRNFTIVNLASIGFQEGVHKLFFGVTYSDMVRRAHRDFATPKGYILSANYSLNPANRDFSDLISAYGKVYLPGFMPHNSLSIATAYQTSIGGYKFPNGGQFLGYKSTQLIPRGIPAHQINSNDFIAGSINYEFPLWYPEGGIGSLLYIKRVRLNLGADYAQFRTMGSMDTKWNHINSYGGDITLDFNVFRMPDAATSTVTFSIYKPSNNGVWFSVGLGLPI